MNKITDFIKATVIGGLIFMIPVTVTIFVITKALQILGVITVPLAEKMGITRVAGISMITILTIFFLLVLCFIAGLFMRTATAHSIKNKLENNVLVYIPGYSYIKALSIDKLSKDDTNGWKPATIFADDNEIICFVIDESEHYCTIFLPSAPSPSSGSVCVRKKENVNYLPLTVTETIRMIRNFGSGGAAVMEKVQNAFRVPE